MLYYTAVFYFGEPKFISYMIMQIYLLHVNNSGFAERRSGVLHALLK